jgi:ankyrin repeat protein
VNRLLLARDGIEVNAVTSSGSSALIVAAAKGHSTACDLLLSAGADANMRIKPSPDYLQQQKEKQKEKQKAKAAGGMGGDKYSDGDDDDDDDSDAYLLREGVTAVMAAAESGHLESLQVLVRHGADVTSPDAHMSSPLVNAIRGNHTDVARYLLQHGANPNDIFVDDEVCTMHVCYACVLCMCAVHVCCTLQLYNCTCLFAIGKDNTPRLRVKKNLISLCICAVYM